MNQAHAANLLEETLKSFKVPNMEGLLRGDREAVAVVWENRNLMLRLTAMEITYEDEAHRPELEHLLAEVKATCLQCTPCLRKLMLSGAEKLSGESIECASRAYHQMVQFLEEACEYMAPEMLSLHAVKFG